MDKNIIVGAAFFSWGETHRMVSISEELANRGYNMIFLGEGKYDFLLDGKPFQRVIPETDKDWFTPERVACMLNMDNLKGDYSTYEELKTHIVDEANVIKQYNPVATLTGYRPTFSISSRIHNIPLVSCMPTVVSLRYFTEHLTELPEESPLNHYFSREQLSQKKYQDKLLKLMKEMAPYYNRLSDNWNKVNKDFGLPPFSSEFAIYEGDLNLMTDAREIYEKIMPETETYKFSGPIIYHNDADMPAYAQNYKKGKRRTILISVGSTSKNNILEKVLESLKQVDYDYFVATPGMLSEEFINSFPSNFHFENNVPLIKMLDLCDGCIVSGGQGTLYSVLVSGKPMLAIPMFMEQQYNIQNILSQYECGVIIKQNGINEENIRSKLQDILENPKYTKEMQKVSNFVKKYYYDYEYSAEKVSADWIEKYLNGELHKK